MYYANSLTEEQALHVAEAYFKAGKDPKKIAGALGVPTFDLNLLRHPLVKRKINQLAERMRKSYTLDDHLSKLQEIRDLALDQDNFRIALQAELSIGKAAGLYERILEAPTDGLEPAEKLSTDEIRKRLASVGVAMPLPLEDHTAGNLAEDPDLI